MKFDMKVNEHGLYIFFRSVPLSMKVLQVVSDDDLAARRRRDRIAIHHLLTTTSRSRHIRMHSSIMGWMSFATNLALSAGYNHRALLAPGCGLSESVQPPWMLSMV
jgi:hypothetical protein